ncbi:MAG: hypothetical protein RLZZ387_2096 [Chloroflexota bacterium]|jgi:hypothetical protein
MLECLEILCSLRNAIIHTNGQYVRMDAATQTRVDLVVVRNDGVQVREGRLELSSTFVRAALLSAGWAITTLSEPFRTAAQAPRD